MLKAWEPIGKPEAAGDHSKQRIRCGIADREVTLTARQSGIVVCSDWKECPSHGKKKGFSPCPETIAEQILVRLKMISGKRGIRFME